jgi:Alginate export
LYKHLIFWAVLAAYAVPVWSQSVAAQAAPWSPVYTGSYVTRYESRRGYDDLNLSAGRERFSEGDAVFYRLRLGLGTGLFEIGRGLRLGLQFTPQATGTFGDNGPNTLVDARLGLHEGYARVQGKRVRFDAGRYEMRYGDALMIGNNDWNELGRSFDGVRAHIASDPDSAWFDVFASVIDEGRPDFRGAADGDLYFLGAYGALGPSLRAGLELDLYLLSRVWGRSRHEAADGVGGYRRQSAAELTFGTRSKARFGDFDYRVEAGVQTGSRAGVAPVANTVTESVERVDVLAYQGDLELGLWLLQDRVRLALEGLYASGAKPGSGGRSSHGWADLFPSAHKWLGLSDAFTQDGMKRTNVASGVLHLSATPCEALLFQLDGHVFARPQAQLVGGDRGLAGGELDAGVEYMIANGLRVRALYGVFVADANLYRDRIPASVTGRDPEPVQYFEAELRYDLSPR